MGDTRRNRVPRADWSNESPACCACDKVLIETQTCKAGNPLRGICAATQYRGRIELRKKRKDKLRNAHLHSYSEARRTQSDQSTASECDEASQPNAAAAPSSESDAGDNQSRSSQWLFRVVVACVVVQVWREGFFRRGWLQLHLLEINCD